MMNRTENQTTTWSGVAAFSTHAPMTTPPMHGGYPYGPSPKTAGPSHHFTAIVGATCLAVLMIVMAGVGLQRWSDVSLPLSAVAAATVPQDVVVPHGAAAELADSLEYLPATVSAVAAATVPQVVVPHGAAAELADSLEYLPATVSAVAAATVPQVVVPHGAAPVE